MQDDLIFRPTPLDPNTSYRWGEEVYIPVSGDLNLHGLYQSQVDAEGAILYLHGNRGNTRWCQRQAETFDGYGQNVLLLDYRGYGKSEGEVSNLEQLHDDIIKAYKWLVNKNPGLPITVAGYSLGSGMASYLAAHEEVEHLLLIAPYTSILDMKDQILPIIPDFLLKAIECYKKTSESNTFNNRNLNIIFNRKTYAIWFRPFTKYLKGNKRIDYYRVQTFYPIENQTDLEKLNDYERINTDCGFNYLIKNVT